MNYHREHFQFLEHWNFINLLSYKLQSLETLSIKHRLFNINVFSCLVKMGGGGGNQFSSIEIILFFLVFYGQLADAHIMVNMKREDTLKIINTAIFFYLGGTKLNDLIISNKIDRNECSSTAKLSEAMIK